ncbi:unnamed protein product [Adineta ricciae]|uniref:NHL repeat containing protein n=1 Tax=Adineta ricciae TaxID=249248 RepID=A0A814TDM6_ADIRI|nr:unnamed protein product [Adineta ricciae]
MSTRSRIEPFSDHSHKVQLKVIEISRHRHSRNHHRLSSSLPTLHSRTIHTSIRSKNSHRSIGKNSVARSHGQEKSISKSIVQQSRTIISSSVSSGKVRPTPSEARECTFEDDSSSIKTDPVENQRCSPDLFSAVKWTDRKGVTNNYHKNRENNRKKKYTRSIIICSIITAFILCIAVVATLLAVLIKPNVTSSNSTPDNNPCVTRIFWNTTGTIYAGNGSQGPSLNQLSSPTGIFIDSNDALYIDDTGHARSLKYLPGAATGVLVAGGSSGSGLNELSAMGTRFNYADSNQATYIADAGNHRIIRWLNGASSGVIVAGNGTPGSTLNQVRNPYGVWVDSSSNVYASEYFNHRVTKWSPGATAGIIVAGGNGQGSTIDKLNNPTSIYYDESNQNLYIVNTGSHTVTKWRINAPNGTIVAGIAGSSGSSSTQLSGPLGVTLDQWKNVYVVDSLNSRIQLFCKGDTTGVTIAGFGSGGSFFILPYGVALDSQLNLCVSENGAARVTKFWKL